MVYVFGVINFFDECFGGIGGLMIGEDVKVVVCGVLVGVVFGVDGCVKDDDVFDLKWESCVSGGMGGKEDGCIW